MKDERHLVVQEPDGSVAIAFNPEVPPPPDSAPLPEVVQQVVRIKYTLATQFACIVLFATCIIQIFLYKRGVDVLNMVFIGTTTIAVFSERPSSAAWITAHGFTAGLLSIITAAMFLWNFAVYQLACWSVCVMAIVTCEAIFE
jgi:hypothetical protein